jgi:hypothetical protein
MEGSRACLKSSRRLSKNPTGHAGRAKRATGLGEFFALHEAKRRNYGNGEVSLTKSLTGNQPPK